MSDTTLFRKLPDQDGRLMSQSNHPVRVWMPDSFIESERKRSSENASQKAENRGRVREKGKYIGSSV